MSLNLGLRSYKRHISEVSAGDRPAWPWVSFALERKSQNSFFFFFFPSVFALWKKFACTSIVRNSKGPKEITPICAWPLHCLYWFLTHCNSFAFRYISWSSRKAEFWKQCRLLVHPQRHPLRAMSLYQITAPQRTKQKLLLQHHHQENRLQLHRCIGQFNHLLVGKRLLHLQSSLKGCLHQLQHHLHHRQMYYIWALLSLRLWIQTVPLVI